MVRLVICFERNSVAFILDVIFRAMLHDPAFYPDPETFNPDRFLRDGKIDPDVLDPTRMAFGFGRR